MAVWDKNALGELPTLLKTPFYTTRYADERFGACSTN